MNNWCLGDGVWVNYDLLERIYVRECPHSKQYEVIGVPPDGGGYPLFDRYFDAEEDAQEFLNSYMCNQRMRS